MIVAAIFLSLQKRKQVIFIVIGMTVCLLSSYISTFLTLCYGADKVSASLGLAPMVEEIMKLFPVLFYILVFDPKKDEAVESSLIIAVGFATFENVCYLITNDASNILHLLIRGFGTGAMHVVTGLLVAFGLYFLWDRPFIKVVGTIVLVCMTSFFHSIYNILVSQTGLAAIIGYCIPMAMATIFVVFKKKILNLSELFDAEYK